MTHRITYTSAAAQSFSVLVIGGGIAGLAAALRVRSLAPDAAVTLLEMSSKLGGKIAGDLVDGCVADGGADVCIGERFRSTHLFEQLELGARTIRVNPNALPTYQFRDRALHRLPASFDGELLTFPGGMHSLVAHVCSALSGVALRTHTSATALARDGSLWRVMTEDGTTLTATTVIIAAPAAAAARLLQGIAPNEASQLAQLKYPSTTTVTMVWRSRDVARTLDGTGYLVADPDSAVTACTWVSAKNPAHARADVAVLRCYIRGAGGDPVALMRSEVASSLGIIAEPLFARSFRWDAGIPVYDDSHAELVRQIADALRRSAGVYVAGSAFHGVGIPDCILSGERAASDAVKHAAKRSDDSKTGEAA